MNSSKYHALIKEYLYQQFNLPEEQVVLMLPEFMNTLASHMERLEGVLKENNFSSLAKAGHIIKGAFLNLGLTEAAEIALQIEEGGLLADNSIDYSFLVKNMRKIVNDIINE